MTSATLAVPRPVEGTKVQEMDPLAGCDAAEAGDVAAGDVADGDVADGVEDDATDEPGPVGWAPLVQPYTRVAMARMTNGVRSRIRSSLVDIEAGAHLE